MSRGTSHHLSHLRVSEARLVVVVVVVVVVVDARVHGSQSF